MDGGVGVGCTKLGVGDCALVSVRKKATAAKFDRILDGKCQGKLLRWYTRRMLFKFGGGNNKTDITLYGEGRTDAIS